MVIIIDLGQRQKSAYNAENTTDLPETRNFTGASLFFHNLEPQNAGPVDVKEDLYKRKIKRSFVRENLKVKHRY